MAHISKRFAEAKSKVNRTPVYPPSEAVRLVKELATAKFDETVEVHIKLGVDPNKGEENVRGTIALPHGTGRTRKVVVFAEGDAAVEAREAGADRIGGEDLIADIEGGWEDFDVLVAHPQFMPVLGRRLGKKLGPRMPSSRAGTVAPDVGRIVRELKAGRVEFKMDKGAVLHVPIGRASFAPDQLEENLNALLSAVMRARPAAAKGRYIHSIVLASTMGPGVKLNLQEALAKAA